MAASVNIRGEYFYKVMEATFIGIILKDLQSFYNFNSLLMNTPGCYEMPKFH